MVYDAPPLGGTCCKNGHGAAEVLDDDPNAPEPEKEPEKEPEEVKQPESEFDFSKVDPTTCECWGTIDPEHPECIECQFKDGCAKEAASR